MARHAARLLLSEGYQPDVVYTSRLKRAIYSSRALLDEINMVFLPVFKTFRLNARSYGVLSGLSKQKVASEFGKAAVHAWRNNLKARPPPLSREDSKHPIYDRRYADIEPEELPSTESIHEAVNRAQPLFDYKIKDELAAGNNVLIIAHKESIRGIMRAIDGVSDKKVMNIPVLKGMPMVYRFDKNLQPLQLPNTDPQMQVNCTSAAFLEKPGLLNEAIRRHNELQDQFDGDSAVDRYSSTERALLQLREEQGILDPVDHTDVADDDPWADDPSVFEEYDFFADDEDVGSSSSRTIDEFEAAATKIPHNNIVMLNHEAERERGVDAPVVVFVRHGRTPHNNLGLFTGWEDPPLAPDGVKDAKKAGRLLRKHGFEFDVLYTSWLTRAIQTGTYILDELDSPWVPIVKSWRLNERHYGELQGKSKSMIRNEYGEEQLTKWRRSYKVPPPEVSSFSPSYPGNDIQRTRYVRDLRISFSESLVRSLEKRKLDIHRKFPKSESLHQCMSRSIPFYVNKIKKEAVDEGKRVLITSHENAIRGILMHLCEIPEEAMSRKSAGQLIYNNMANGIAQPRSQFFYTELHLPNGLPLVYDVRGKCVSLLLDESDEEGSEPVEANDFGPAAQYLFRPCELGDDFFDEMQSKELEEAQEAVELTLA